MLVSELIDQIIAHTDNISPAGADFELRRAKILFWIREEAAATYYFREWTWRVKDGTVTVTPPATYGLLPADFLSFGRLGGLWRADGGGPLEPAAESDVQDLIVSNQTISVPTEFSVRGTDGGNPPRRKLYVGLLSAEQVMPIIYAAKLPALDESAGDDNLEQAIPEEYHQTVIVPGVRMRAHRSKQDLRWKDDMADRNEGLREMVRQNRRMQAGSQQLPSFFGR